MPNGLLQLSVTIVTALVAGLVLGLLVRRGYVPRVTKLSFPFLELQLDRFKTLSPVEMFTQVSIAFIMPSIELAHDAKITASRTPIILIHTGWTIVCEAFVRRFRAYPNDDQINAAVAEIGGQNAEFIKMYRDIHTHAIRHSNAVSREFASNYLIRAPSLAERIEGIAKPEINVFQHALLFDADSVVRNGDSQPLRLNVQKS